LRILEVFALGRAVVSTSIGCEGLGVDHDEHLLVTDEPEEFAQACLALLRTPALRARLIARALVLAEQQYSWESVQQRDADVATGLIEDVRSASRARNKP